MIIGKFMKLIMRNLSLQDRRDIGMTDQIAGELIAAYNRGFNDGYECGLKDWHLYEQDMKKMREEEERG